jgi:hypothetical protein
MPSRTSRPRRAGLHRQSPTRCVVGGNEVSRTAIHFVFFARLVVGCIAIPVAVATRRRVMNGRRFPRVLPTVWFNERQWRRSVVEFLPQCAEKRHGGPRLTPEVRLRGDAANQSSAPHETMMAAAEASGTSVRLACWNQLTAWNICEKIDPD